jgi:hypothetical protein
MRCRNCDNHGPFVLLVELRAVVPVPGDLRRRTWSLSVECPGCASTDVAGDPAALLVGPGTRR